MEPITFDQTGPKNFIIAADGAFTKFHPENEHIWALRLESSETHPFYLHTTYNLRAKSMRLFPNLIGNNHRFNKSSDFSHRPTVSKYTPASIQITYGLINGIEVQFDCFIPEPDVLTGEVRLYNTTKDQINLIIELAAILVPMDKGQATRPVKKGLHHIITGQTETLCPVLFMTGGPTATSSPFPALSLKIHIPPHQSVNYCWALVTKNSCSSSYETAQHIVATPWKKTALIHAMKHDSQTLHIKTGNSDWDATFSLAQVSAMTHLVNPSSDSIAPLFIRSRMPDQATATAQVQSNLDDITTLEAVHLTQILLPAKLNFLKGQLNNYFARVDDKGWLHSRLNPSTFLQPFREPPLLTQLCLALYETNKDFGFLQSMYDNLCQLIGSWLEPQQGLSGIRPLVWESAQQCQLNSGHFIFNDWQETGQGLDITTVESPALAAMLYREVSAIHKIASILDDKSGQKQYQQIKKALKERIQAFWRDDLNRFVYQDRQSQLSPPRELYYPGPVQKSLEIMKTFSAPQRLLLHLYSFDEKTRVCKICIKGVSPEGEEFNEEFKTPNIHWIMGRAHLTSKKLYRQLKSISFTGMDDNDRFLLETADLMQSDISCLLPIWSGAAKKEQIQSIIDSQLNPQDTQLQYGIPETWQCHHDLPDNLSTPVNILWNTLIIEGLARSGYTKEAMALFSNLMSSSLIGLKDYDGFFPCYHSKTGHPTGQTNAISGLAPVQLFLQISGIKLFTPNRIAVWGANPFPWPVTVQWQGLSLRRDGVDTQVIFADGTHYESSSEKPVLLTPGRNQEHVHD